MAGRRKRITMQGLGNPVSAVGQGGKAGPQPSPSSDRSSSCVGDLAHVEYNATRKRSHGTRTFHKCDKNSDSFCYICCQHVLSKMGSPITDKIKTLYKDCFNIEIQHQDTDWVPHIICSSCKIMLYNINKKAIKYSRPAIWNRPYSENDCYFCMNVVSRHNRKNKSTITYNDVSTVTRPTKLIPPPEPLDADVMETNDFTLSVHAENIETVEKDSNTVTNECSSDNLSYTSDTDKEFLPYNRKPEPILVSQSELSDLVRDLGLSKDGSEHLASFLKKRHLLKPEATISYYRNRDEEFRKYFTMDEELSLSYCTDVKGLMDEFQNNSYDPEEWRLFIDSSKRSIKAVLLHNTNVYAPIPIAHSTVMEEQYEKMKQLLIKIKYADHNWKICGDLKILTILLGQQSGFTLYPCYKCLWNSRDRERHYKKKIWPTRESFTPGENNVLFPPLVDPGKVLIPPLHIKLGLMKQFTRALDTNGPCFKYLHKKFPKFSEAKIKAGVFDGPQIRKLFQDSLFVTKMNKVEKAAWLSFKEVATNFLGNNKSPKYKEIVEKMVKNFQTLGCLMNLKLHFLDSHIDDFPDNLGDYSEEQGERFHQDLKIIENRYQGRWDDHMLADYCWSLKRETSPQKRLGRKPLNRSFAEKKNKIQPKKGKLGAGLTFAILGLKGLLFESIWFKSPGFEFIGSHF